MLIIINSCLHHPQKHKDAVCTQAHTKHVMPVHTHLPMNTHEHAFMYTHKHTGSFSWTLLSVPVCVGSFEF